MLEARLAEVHLAVDHAGQHVQAARVDHLGRRRGARVADGSDTAAPDADVALADAVVVDDCATLDQIESNVALMFCPSRVRGLASGPCGTRA